MTIAVDQGIDFDALAKALDNEETVTEAQGGFWLSHGSGATGFPTLLALENGEARTIAIGYQPLKAFVDRLRAWAAAPIPAPDNHLPLAPG